MFEAIYTRINITANDLHNAELLLNKADCARRTKKEMHELLGRVIPLITENRMRLDKYHNALIPLVAKDDKNSVCEELQKAKEDIEAVQYLIYHRNYDEADKLLQDIKERL